MDEPVIGAHLDLGAPPQVRDRSGHGGRPARKAARAGIGVAARHQGVPSGAGEERQASVDRDEVDRASVPAHQDLDDRLRRRRKAQKVARRVSESGRQIAEGQPLTTGGNVVRDAKRAVAAGDHGRAVAVDALGEPGGELRHVTGGGDVQVGVERAAGKLHRAPDGVGPCAAGPLVEEDGRARAH